MNLTEDATGGKVELDLPNLSEDDLASLEVSDPFLYNSIQAIHEARLINKEVNHAELLASINDAPERSHVVSRKTRLSTECHPDKALEDLLAMDDEEFVSLCQASDILDVFDLIGLDLDHKTSK